MKWIGLTGSIGSGKSTVARLLAARGCPVADADQFARLALGPGSAAEAQVLAAFGPAVQNQAGHLDRRLLAKEVFSQPDRLKVLESIVHPLVQAMTRARRDELAKAGHHMAFYDVPLLFEKNLESQFDGVVVVFAEVETCVRRVMERNRLPRGEIEARVRSQLSIEQKIKKAHWVVRNDGTPADLEKAVDKLLDDLSRKFPKA